MFGASTCVQSPALPCARSIVVRVNGVIDDGASSGNSFGTEYPIAFMNPNFPLLGPFGSAGIPAAQSSDYFFVDLPGGPGGC